VHATLASVHVLWLLLRNRVSRSWDSIAELIALAQNSQPAEKVLQNTGAGIGLFHTFATMARIRVRPAAAQGTAQQDRVELVFEGDRGQERGTSSSDELDESLELQGPQGAPVSVPDPHNCVPASWTFPIDRTKLRISHQTHSHGHNESAENLIARMRKDTKAQDLVQIDHAYS